ncbi:MAG: TIGR03000 domain-containing protein [Planctomycetes bacterium]|nr:TIGR03000 domain-containing protein [Planctomycetota bacterium]
MYSAVLMLALTAGAETADFGRNRCQGCTAAATTACPKATAAHCSTASSCARARLFGNRCAHTSARPAAAATTCARSHGAASHGCQGGLLSRLFAGRCSQRAVTTCAATTQKKEEVPTPKKKEEKKDKKPDVVSAPATIVVNLPANARLTVDGVATTSTSERRTMVTPALEVGESYVYTFRAEVGGQFQTQQVTVRGGETSTVLFQFPSQGVASR